MQNLGRYVHTFLSFVLNINNAMSKSNGTQAKKVFSQYK